MKFAASGIWALAAWLAFAGAAWAGLPETPRPQQLSVFDGLPSNAVRDVAEDAQGYLWFATADGLARYDGHGFRIWRREDGLADNALTAVHVDAENQLWVGSESGGLMMLDAQRRKVTRFGQVDGVRLGASAVWDVTRTSDGALWLGTDYGLYRMHGGKLRHFVPDGKDPRSLPGKVVTSLEIAHDGSLWVGTDQGAARWSGRDFVRVSVDSATNPRVEGIAPDRNGDVWLRMVPAGGVVRANGRGSLQDWKLPPPVMVYGPILQDQQGGYWLYTNFGLLHVDEDGRRLVVTFSRLTRSQARPQFQRGLVDRTGGLWFTSEDDGVWHLAANWRRFAVLAHDGHTGYALGNLQVFGAANSRNGTMWLVGTTGTLDELDPESGRVEHRYVSSPPAVFKSVLESSDGQVWIGGRDQLMRFDPVGGGLHAWTRNDAEEAAMDGEATWLAEDRKGRIWAWHEGSGLQVRDLQGRVVANIARDQAGLPATMALSQMRRSGDGMPWLSGSAGLLRWDEQKERFVPVPGVLPGEAFGFDFGEKGTVWLGRSEALEEYEPSPSGLRLKRRHKIGADFRGITLDRRGIVWLASTRGLIRFDPQGKNSRIYDIRDGFPGQEILAAPLMRPQDGRLLALASHGVVVLDPATLRPAETRPRLVIDAVRVGQSGERVELPANKPFTIAHDSRDLTIVARLLAFENVHGHRYRFRLSGFDENWVPVDSAGERVFSRLPPGGYTLQVQGFNADGVASEIRELHFSVTPPWWRTWWALTLFAVILALLAWAAADAYRDRLRRRSAWQLAEHKRALAEQASLAKTRFLATLGHEVRTPMTGVLGMSELLLGTPLDEKQRGYASAIHNAGTHLLRLVNDALDLARIEADKLELDEQDFDLRELVAGVVDLIAPVARKRGLRFDQAIDASAPPALRGDPMRVRQILLNLLGNAVKFTEQGSVGLHVSAREGGGVRFIVSDTGPGLNAAQRERLFQRFEQAEGARTAARYGGSGLGLAICQELAHAMGGRIDVESAPGEGARFIVDLPLAEAATMPPSTRTETRAASAPRTLRALLVEDDPTVAEVIVGLLQAQGHTVRHAPHGLAALMEVASGEFDIALLDLDLPGLDGLALAQQLRAQGFGAPLLAVTARADADAEPAARAAGFDGFLRKPLTGAMLARAIEELIGRP